jgi:hypothetical protein
MTETAITRAPTGMELLAEISHRTDCPPEVAMAVAKAAVDLQIQMEEFQWKREERQAKIDFDQALNECQSKIGRIAPNQQRNDTHSWWADYAELDRTIRPIYTAAGFSIAFSEVQSLAVGKVRIRAELSRGGISKEYFSEITPSTQGPKGGAMATATDADAIAQSRAKRYLMLSIFNIAVGIDKIEKEGISDEIIASWEEKLAAAKDKAELNKITFEAIEAVKGNINAVTKIGAAKNKRLTELEAAK